MTFRCVNMSQNRTLSGPADNPQYFSVTARQGQGAAMAGELPATPRLTAQDLGDLEPTMTRSVCDSCLGITLLSSSLSDIVRSQSGYVLYRSEMYLVFEIHTLKQIIE